MRALPASLVSLCFLPFALACSSKSNTFGGDDASTGDGDIFGDGSGADTGLPACATGDYEAKQAPAAMLVLMQRSGSMSMNNKWVFAAQAIVQALDAPVFDTMTLGFMAAPNGTVTGPACVANLPVACGVPAFPQVDLAMAGVKKASDPSGVRHDIKAWLSNNAPDQSAGDGNPLYAAIQSGLGSLQGWSGMGKRILFFVTDGAISCASVSNRTGNAFMDGNMCPDWENPNNIMKLVSDAQKDPNKPVDTFVVGVPGSNSYDMTGVNFPPYHMRAALSDIAKSGSPNNVPMGCNATMPFTQNDPDPAKSCHFDMTQNYNAQQVADAISLVRGKVLGCAFDLPTPEAGVVDTTKVNVDYSINGGASMALYKRADMNNMCTTDGCWDYDANGKVLLIGKACTDVSGTPNAKVHIVVGCATIVK